MDDIIKETQLRNELYVRNQAHEIIDNMSIKDIIAFIQENKK